MDLMVRVIVVRRGMVKSSGSQYLKTILKEKKTLEW